MLPVSSRHWGVVVGDDQSPLGESSDVPYLHNDISRRGAHYVGDHISSIIMAQPTFPPWGGDYSTSQSY